ncbi:MAG: ABC transporter ATP-binding protein [Chloroflexota bacterium]
MKTIRAVNITKYYGSVKAVDSISFEVQSGELLTLLGPSGCGKTTTLRMIAGLERPDDGEIWVGDTLVSSAERGVFLAPEKRGMGMVFQSYALWPHMTVFENVSYPLRMKGFPRNQIRDRVMTMLETVGMGGMDQRPAPLLSGGQAQRVALARALVFDPNVLLLDEPLSNLDAKLREEMRFEIKAIQTRVGVTSVFVTHDQGEAMVLSDNMIVMSRGTIEQQGPPTEVYDRPATRFVMDFLGQSNHLSATVARDEDGRAVARIEDAGGANVPLSPEMSWKDGDHVDLAFRPQDVSLAPANGSDQWTGEVEAVAYLGTHAEYVIKLGATTIRAVVPGSGVLPRGSRARCDIDSSLIRVWNFPTER